jgi:truncated hemoglobin YjbI
LRLGSSTLRPPKKAADGSVDMMVTHWYSLWRMAGLYEALGGTEGCLKLSAAFYARVDADPVLRPLFPGKSHRCAIEAFAAFLVQFLGGPAEDSQRRWWVSLRESHLRFQIGRKERNAWMKNMAVALEAVEMPAPVRRALRDLFERSSTYLINYGDARPTDGGCPHEEIARRWEKQLTLDRAVEAVRKGDPELAIRLAPDGPDCLALLALMLGRGDCAMTEYVRKRVRQDPALAHGYYFGRTLLHDAGASADVKTVELLLQLGADPNAGAHSPLYAVGNECKTKGGGDVVRALVKGGADVNAPNGVKRCTALHMAARRGNVEVALALIQCGAEIGARDSVGDTPLRRAVNCKKAAVAELLRRQGPG